MEHYKVRPNHNLDAARKLAVKIKSARRARRARIFLDAHIIFVWIEEKLRARGMRRE